MRTPANVAGHPIHPMLVTLPIGLWVFSFVCDLLFIFGSRAAEWNIVALYTMGGGIVGAIVAATLGAVVLLLEFDGLLDAGRHFVQRQFHLREDQLRRVLMHAQRCRRPLLFHEHTARLVSAARKPAERRQNAFTMNPRDVPEEPPPFLGTWPRVYAAVLAYLFILILLFYLFARAFNR